MHTKIYIAAPSTHSLFMSHFPTMYCTVLNSYMCTVLDQFVDNNTENM